MIRRTVLSVLAVVMAVLGCVVLSTPTGAVVDTAVIVPSPNAGSSDNRLYSVSCVSASECVAVGYTNTGSVNETLVLSLTGPVTPSTTTTTVASDPVVPAFTG